MFKQGYLWKTSQWSLLYLMLFLAHIFSTNNLLYCQGFVAGTMVKVPHGYQAIEEIKKGDVVISYSGCEYVKRPVVGTVRSKIPYFYQVYIGHEIIGIAPNQRLYVPQVDEWVAVHTLADNQAASTNRGSLCINRIVRIDEKIDVFDFTVAHDHNFCVTNYDIVAHNFVPVVVGLSWLIGAGAAEFAGFSLATVMAGVAAGVIVHNKDSKKDIEFKLSQDLNDITADGGSPNDPDEDSFFNKLKARTKKVVRTKRFGKRYEDPNTKLWWSRDRANHGGSHYKVYEKVGKGLKWFYDADRHGNKIIGKHKGPIGLFIPTREIISCQ